jgi:hypothetical protein
MRSVMKHRFSEVPTIDVPRSTFMRNHGLKTAFDAGYLVPIFWDQDVLPGDTISLNMQAFARLATPQFPIMDNMFISTFFFSVPWRLIWDNSKKFFGEQIDPGDSISYTIPQVTLNNVSNGTLYDYFGVVTKVATNVSYNSLLFRAYNKVFADWFRDQNLQDSPVLNTDDGPDTSTDYALLKRGKRHDYFSSALPFLQKGDAVQLSLGTDAPVVSDGTGVPKYDLTGDQRYLVHDGSTSTVWNSTTTNPGAAVWDDPELKTDLSSATASTVNELRQSIQIQRFLEKDARSGSRYPEIIKSHYGVTDPMMAVLQRPEYLGGGTTPINIASVARTDSSPGELGSFAQSFINGHGFVKSFSEHCCVIGLACLHADLNYQEGIDRSYLKQTRYDVYHPVLAHIGEQAIENREIYIDAATVAAGTDDDVFGYQERWAEYRYKKSNITGVMRSNDAASLDAWHLAIEFGSEPTLDDTFIQEAPPLDRAIVTPSEPHLIWDSYFNYKHTRPMPIYSVPGFIDHF